MHIQNCVKRIVENFFKIVGHNRGGKKVQYEIDLYGVFFRRVWYQYVFDTIFTVFFWLLAAFCQIVIMVLLIVRKQWAAVCIYDTHYGGYDTIQNHMNVRAGISVVISRKTYFSDISSIKIFLICFYIRFIKFHVIIMNL